MVTLKLVLKFVMLHNYDRVGLEGKTLPAWEKGGSYGLGLWLGRVVSHWFVRGVREVLF